MRANEGTKSLVASVRSGSRHGCDAAVGPFVIDHPAGLSSYDNRAPFFVAVNLSTAFSIYLRSSPSRKMAHVLCCAKI